MKLVAVREMPTEWWPLVRVWRNHPANRRGFGHSDVITIAEHLAWIDSLERRRAVERQYVLLDQGYEPDYPVGTFALIGWDSVRTEASRICIDPDLHRQGYGTILCAAAGIRAQRDFGAKILCLRVLRTNDPARSCYVRAGFDAMAPPDGLAIESEFYVWMERELV